LDEIERTLGLTTSPLNWPVGDGQQFQGVYDLRARHMLSFTRTERGQRRAPVVQSDLNDPALGALLGQAAWERLQEEVDLLDAVGAGFDLERFRAGELTPVLFGSALTNFGVEPFIDA